MECDFFCVAGSDDFALIVIWATYGILVIGWYSMQFQRWWDAKRGKDIDEDAHIGAHLDEEKMKKWLLIIIISSALATLFAWMEVIDQFLQLDLSFPERGSVLIIQYLMPSVIIGAGWLYAKSPALTGLNPWMVTVGIGSMTIASTLIPTFALVYEEYYRYESLLLLTSGWVSTVYVWKLMGTVSAERVRVLRVKAEDDTPKVSDDLNTEANEDDYSSWNQFDEKSELMALSSILCFVAAGVFSGMWWFSIITTEIALIGGAGTIIIVVSITFTKPDTMIKIGRPLYRRNHDDIVAGERLVPNVVNDDGDVPGGWTKEQWEKYGDSSKKR